MVRGGEAAAVTAALATLPKVHGADGATPETVRLGIIGCGGMMNRHLGWMVERKSAVSFAWLCDVDPKRLDSASKKVDGFQSSPAQQTARYEDVVADKDVDAVIIATPHHWHAPIALAALAESKDVYIEKPISHVYDEG